MKLNAIVLSALVTLGCAGARPEPTAQPSPQKAAFSVPVEYLRLENGLRVVLSPDHTAPTATVAIDYKIGFRTEYVERV